jgi:hypothetical protein
MLSGLKTVASGAAAAAATPQATRVPATSTTTLAEAFTFAHRALLGETRRRNARSLAALCATDAHDDVDTLARCCVSALEAKGGRRLTQAAASTLFDVAASMDAPVLRGRALWLARTLALSSERATQLLGAQLCALSLTSNNSDADAAELAELCALLQREAVSVLRN